MDTRFLILLARGSFLDPRTKCFGTGYRIRGHRDEPAKCDALHDEHDRVEDDTDEARSAWKDHVGHRVIHHQVVDGNDRGSDDDCLEIEHCRSHCQLGKEQRVPVQLPGCTCESKQEQHRHGARCGGCCAPGARCSGPKPVDTQYQDTDNQPERQGEQQMLPGQQADHQQNRPVSPCEPDQGSFSRPLKLAEKADGRRKSFVPGGHGSRSEPSVCVRHLARTRKLWLNRIETVPALLPCPIDPHDATDGSRLRSEQGGQQDQPIMIRVRLLPAHGNRSQCLEVIFRLGSQRRKGLAVERPERTEGSGSRLQLFARSVAT